MLMNLYFAEWPDGTISVVHAKNSVDAFWLLDQEGNPYAATVWLAKGEACIISEKTLTGGLAVYRDLNADWRRVVFPGLGAVYDVFREGDSE